MQNNQFDERFEAAKDAAFLDAAAKELAPMPFYKRWAAVYTSARLARFLMQFISAATATTAAVYISYRFTSSLWFGVIIGFVLIGLSEVIKAYSWKEVFTAAVKGQNVQLVAIVVALCTMIFSAGASFIGAPRFLQMFTPQPALISIDSIKIEKKIVEDSLKEYYIQRIDTIDAQKAAVHKAHSWKGKITRDARPLSISLEAKAATTEDSMHTHINRTAAEFMQQTKAAERANAARVQKHAKDLEGFGAAVGWGCVGLEGFIALLMLFQVFYKYRAVTEMRPAMQAAAAEPLPQPVQEFKPQAVEVPPAVPAPVKNPACVWCGKDFVPTGVGQLYCKRKDAEGRTCKQLFTNNKRRKQKDENN